MLGRRACLRACGSAGVCRWRPAGANRCWTDQDRLGLGFYRSQAGQVVFEADTLRTGADGRLGLTLKDDTRLSLGPSSEIRLDRFAYAPAEGRLGFVLNVVRGVAAYVSGRIAKLAPDAVRLESPAAIVGVRGTTVVVRASQE